MLPSMAYGHGKAFCEGFNIPERGEKEMGVLRYKVRAQHSRHTAFA